MLRLLCSWVVVITGWGLRISMHSARTAANNALGTAPMHMMALISNTLFVQLGSPRFHVAKNEGFFILNFANIISSFSSGYLFLSLGVACFFFSPTPSSGSNWQPNRL